MSGLTRAARCYIVAVVAVAAALTALLLWRQPPVERDLLLGATFGLGVALAWLFPVGISLRKKIYVDAAPVFAAVLTMTSGAAALAVVVGILLAYALRRTNRDPVEGVYNAAQTAISAAIASVVLAVTGWDPRAPFFDGFSSLVEIALASGLMFLLNSVILAGMIGLQTGRPLWPTWVRSTLREDPIEVATHLSLSGVGLIAAMLVYEHPWAILMMLPPVAAMLGALRHHAHLRERAERALQGSQADLAEAQRIARLGSWEWELVAERLVWSDQVYRILGDDPAAIAPTLSTLLQRVHPDDRERVQTALIDAQALGLPFSIDHRIVLPDGVERIVHQQGEPLRDESGRVVRMVGTIHDISERKALEAQLAHRAFHDVLTDLPNRALFADRLEQALAPNGSPPGIVAVLFIDLDDFKLINDGIGHDAGDRLLVAVAERLRGALASTQLAARFGGDEFTVLLEGLALPEEAVAVADRLVTVLGEPFQIDGRDCAISVSVGIAHGLPGRSQPLALLRDADAALYRAKAAGKNGVVPFEPGMTAAAIRRLNLQADLRRAVERGELRLLYQPIVDLESGRLAGVEALVRWQHPVHGLVAPDLFLPLAEETGLVLPLGDWVLKTACATAAEWRVRFPAAEALRLAVNLSVRQLRQEGLNQMVAGALAASGLPAGLLELEITEQVIAQELRTLAGPLESLRASGVRLALDDVGSGHSSLAHFQHISFDTVKLDRSFIGGMTDDPRRLAIIEAVAGLARSLAIELTAEGIESTEDLRLATRLGCRYGQGYRFARPLPAAEIERLLAEGLPVDIAHHVVIGQRRPLHRANEPRVLSAVG